MTEVNLDFICSLYCETSFNIADSNSPSDRALGPSENEKRTDEKVDETRESLTVVGQKF